MKFGSLWRSDFEVTADVHGGIEPAILKEVGLTSAFSRGNADVQKNDAERLLMPQTRP